MDQGTDSFICQTVTGPSWRLLSRWLILDSALWQVQGCSTKSQCCEMHGWCRILCPHVWPIFSLLFLCLSIYFSPQQTYTSKLIRGFTTCVDDRFSRGLEFLWCMTRHTFFRIFYTIELDLNGTFHWELAPCDFSLVVLHTVSRTSLYLWCMLGGSVWV